MQVEVMGFEINYSWLGGDEFEIESVELSDKYEALVHFGDQESIPTPDSFRDLYEDEIVDAIVMQNEDQG